MKKFVLALLALIAVLAIILYFKMNGNISANSPTPTPETPISGFNNVSNSANFSSYSSYSSEDIEKLIIKGKENIRKVDNVYYEISSDSTFYKQYYKGSKLKLESYNMYPVPMKSKTTISNFDENITDSFEHIAKTTYTLSYALGSKNLFQEKLIKLIEEKDEYITKFVYVKDDILDERNCIVVKAYCYDARTHEQTGSILTYWIEKSTGYYVGESITIQSANTFELSSTIKNLSFGTVKDSDFVEPKL